MSKGLAFKVFGFYLGVFLFFNQAAAGAEKGVLIKLGTLAPEGSSWMKTFNAVNADVMKQTGNTVQFKLYPGGVLGDEMDMLRKLKIGQIQGVALTSAGLSSLFKEMDVLQIPFLFQTYDEVDMVLNKMDSFFRKGFEENGYVLLTWSEAGFVYLMSTLPVSSVADLRKAKVWIWEDSPMSKAIFDEAGVKAIPLTVPDVLVGLQTGLVDVVYAPPTGAISLQWFTKIKYLTNVPLVYLAGGLVVKRDIFKQLSPTYQNFILDGFQQHAGQLKMITRNENRDALQVMVKNGVKVITPSKDQIDEYKRLSNNAMGHIRGQTFSKKTFEDVNALLDTYRKGGKS
ncbi:MAG TPA: TRAP transporter substrate-binding protein DctP [Thermodesulfobacteriota bacterium]|nr:TRAP transporter substrate-binding protein DctP [Thermodesulfobacteriota bacterium]